MINEKKSDLVPSQTAKYLGTTIDTEAGKDFPSLARVEKFLTVAESFCTMDAPPARLWQVSLGHLASLERLVPHGRLRMRALQWHLKSDPPSLPVPLPREVKRDLSWWMLRDHLLTGVRFGTPAPDLHLYSDVSCSGWGAHLLDQHVSGVWSDQEKLLHINLLEMKALFLGLQAFREDVISHHMTAMCDNSTVVAYVNKQGGTVSQALCLLASRLLRWTESFDVHLDARYLPGHANVLADLLSCCRDRVVFSPSGGEVTTSRLGQSVDRHLCDVPQRETAPVLLTRPGSPGRLRGCVSSSLGPLGPVRVPSLSSGRSGGRPCPRVIAHRMTLVAPLWPEKEWFADLLLLLTQPPLALPWWDSLLRQPHCSLFHQGIHAWRLSSVTSESRVFREGLLESCQGASDPPVEMADLLWLVSWKGRCSSQRHCSSSRGLSNTLTPRQRLVHLCG